MSNEEFVRRAYDIAEVKDIPGWIACFNPDGRFTDNSMDAPCCDVFKLKDGRLQVFDCYPSGTVILSQLGVLGNLESVLEPEPAHTA